MWNFKNGSKQYEYFIKINIKLPVVIFQKKSHLIPFMLEIKQLNFNSKLCLSVFSSFDLEEGRIDYFDDSF
jgi:hypothetical protein